MVNVLKFWTLFTFFSQIKFWFNLVISCCNSQNACQNSKRGRPWSDCFFRSSLIRVCAVCICLFWQTSSVQNFRTFTKIVCFKIKWIFCDFTRLCNTTFCGVLVRPEFFYKLIYKPSYCNFPESREKRNLISKIIFFILSTDSKYCLFRWK